MIKNFIYVEDGSIDVDALQDNLDETTKLIVYRQGSTPPILVQPEHQINDCFESMYNRLTDKLEFVEATLNKIMPLKMSKKLRKILDDLYTDMFC